MAKAKTDPDGSVLRRDSSSHRELELHRRLNSKIPCWSTTIRFHRRARFHCAFSHGTKAIQKTKASSEGRHAPWIRRREFGSLCASGQLLWFSFAWNVPPWWPYYSATGRPACYRGLRLLASRSRRLSCCISAGASKWEMWTETSPADSGNGRKLTREMRGSTTLFGSSARARR